MKNNLDNGNWTEDEIIILDEYNFYTSDKDKSSGQYKSEVSYDDCIDDWIWKFSDNSYSVQKHYKEYFYEIDGSENHTWETETEEFDNLQYLFNWYNE